MLVWSRKFNLPGHPFLSFIFLLVTHVFRQSLLYSSWSLCFILWITAVCHHTQLHSSLLIKLGIFHPLDISISYFVKCLFMRSFLFVSLRWSTRWVSQSGLKHLDSTNFTISVSQVLGSWNNFLFWAIFPLPFKYHWFF